jgi:hypothetical protein
MIILALTFTTLFLAVFSPCLVILHRCEQTKELNAWKQRHDRIEAKLDAQNDAAWRRNKRMIMD